MGPQNRLHFLIGRYVDLSQEIRDYLESLGRSELSELVPDLYNVRELLTVEAMNLLGIEKLQLLFKQCSHYGPCDGIKSPFQRVVIDSGGCPRLNLMCVKWLVDKGLNPKALLEISVDELEEALDDKDFMGNEFEALPGVMKRYFSLADMRAYIEMEECSTSSFKQDMEFLHAHFSINDDHMEFLDAHYSRHGGKGRRCDASMAGGAEKAASSSVKNHQYFLDKFQALVPVLLSELVDESIRFQCEKTRTIYTNFSQKMDDLLELEGFFKKYKVEHPLEIASILQKLSSVLSGSSKKAARLWFMDELGSRNLAQRRGVLTAMLKSATIPGEATLKVLNSFLMSEEQWIVAPRLPPVGQFCITKGGKKQTLQGRWLGERRKALEQVSATTEGGASKP
jgi:hypothetical protein